MRSISSKKHLVLGMATFGVICILILAVTVFTHRPVKVDEETFPDDVFREYVSAKVDINRDGEVSNDEAIKLVSLTLDGAQNLDGISYFPNLQSIRVTGDSLTSVDLSHLRKLQHADFSGDTNLSKLVLGRNTSLLSLDVSNTNINVLDLSEAPSLETLHSDSDTDVINAPTERVSLVESYESNKGDTQDRSETVVNAQYNDVGELTHRQIVGTTSLNIDYSYDDFGRPVSVLIDDKSGALTKQWDITYGENGLDVHATTGSGDLLSRTYDDYGRIKAFTLRTTGISGDLDLAFSYEYDVRGMLSGIILSSDSKSHSQRYVTSYDGAGNLLSLSSGEDVYYYNDGMIAAPVFEYSDGVTTNREYQKDGESARITEFRVGSDGTIISRADGIFEYDQDEGYLVWGSVQDTDDNERLVYNVESNNYDVPLNHIHVNNSAVDFRYLTSPDVVCDYWLPGDIRWVLDQEICSIVRTQKRSLMADGNIIYRDKNTYSASDVCYDSLIDELDESQKYLFYDLDGDNSDELVVSHAGNTAIIDSIYTLVGDTPTLSIEAEDDESLSLSSNGFLVDSHADGTESHLLRFNGLTFEDLSISGQTDELTALYPSLRGLSWT